MTKNVTLRRTGTRMTRDLLADRSGASAIMVGLVLTGLLGFAGLGTEVGKWYVTKRTMQGATDAAAFGAALAAGGGSTNYTSEAKSIAAGYGFVDGTNGVTVTVNKPPTSGNYQSSTAAIEVIITDPQAELLSHLFMRSALTIAARSVATIGAGPDCVLSLNQQASVDTFLNGTTDVNLIKCGIAVDSNSPTALDIVGGAQINADSASVVGGISGSGNLTTVNGTFTGAAVVPDPYQNLQVPAYSGCNQNNYTVNHSSPPPIDAGGGIYVFCNGISMNGGTLTLQHGTFIIDRGDISLHGNATLITNDATVILTSSTGANYGTIQSSSGNTIIANAPKVGSTSGITGIAFFQDRNAPVGNDSKFNGGSAQSVSGAIYFPSGIVEFAGGAATGSGCTQLVANEVDFKGNSNLEINCTGYGLATLQSTPKLVE